MQKFIVALALSAAALGCTTKPAPKPELSVHRTKQALGEDVLLTGWERQFIYQPGTDPADADGGTDAGPSDIDMRFGSALAFSNGIVVVGAANYPGDPTDSEPPGAVFFYKQSGNRWVNQGILQPPAGVEYFGESLVASPTALAVHAHFTSGASLTDAVWTFAPSTNGWTPTGSPLLPPSQLDPIYEFGGALAIEGKWLFVSCSQCSGQDSDGGVIDHAGAVFAYKFDDASSTWLWSQTLSPPNGGVANGSFGLAFAVNGGALVVGAPSTGNGAAYAFKLSAAQDSWEPGPSITVPTNTSFYGYSVALSDSWLAIGATSDNNTGAVYAYARQAASWGDAQRLDVTGQISPDPTAQANEAFSLFGTAVALSATQLFASAQQGVVHYTDPDGDQNPGRIQVFHLGGDWHEEGRLFPGPAALSFGTAIAAASPSLILATATSAVYAFAGAQGVGCQNPFDCNSGYCADAFCCDTACAGTCMSCSGATKGDNVDGTCGLVAKGKPPRSGCDVTATTSAPCGQTGLCDGDGGCALQGADTICAPASCSSTMNAVGVSKCDGQGACVAPMSTACGSGYVCSEGTCAVACAQSSECQSGYYCFGGACVTGARCSTDKTVAYSASGVGTTCTGGACKDGACLMQCAANSDCLTGFVCEPNSQTCMRSCSKTEDCAGSGYCFSGACITSARCSADLLTAYSDTGAATLCKSALCGNGTCGTQCQRTLDCVSGLVCDPTSKSCIAQGALDPHAGSGCALGVPGHNKDAPSWHFLLALVASLAARHRLRRQARNTNL